MKNLPVMGSLEGTNHSGRKNTMGNNVMGNNVMGGNVMGGNVMAGNVMAGNEVTFGAVSHMNTMGSLVGMATQVSKTSGSVGLVNAFSPLKPGHKNAKTFQQRLNNVESALNALRGVIKHNNG